MELEKLHQKRRIVSEEISRLLGPTDEKNASAFGTTMIKQKITPV